MIVSKGNFKLVSQFFLNVSILCPSALLCVVKALHGRCPYHCIVQKIHEFRGLALTKLTIFTVLSKIYFKLLGIPLAARASWWMLQCTQVASGATACTCITTPLCLPVMAGFCAISTDTYTSSPPKSIWCHKAVQYFKNILSCCPVSSGFQKRMFSLIDPP
jgi:hypothetical protein